MKAFVSWSGGKDCMFALYKFLQQDNNQAICLLNMCNASGNKSRSHGISSQLIKQQANALNIDIIQQAVGMGEYEILLKKNIEILKSKNGIEAGVFGDIFLEEHRVWIERVCSEMGIEAIFPLWGIDTKDVVEQFVSQGFKTLVVSVRKEKLSADWLGRFIDSNFINEISILPNIDPCGEGGEYHTFVIDGPIFETPLSIQIGEKSEDNKHLFLDIK